jgi:membrane-associated phospholipid phosphatase
MGLAPLTSEELKPLLAHPHVQIGVVHIGAASWPSGHSTAAMALVMSAVLVTPPRLRLLVASIGALFAAAVGCALLILAWHMPSDVNGGYLVASLWTALAVCALRAADRRWPPRSPA